MWGTVRVSEWGTVRVSVGDCESLCGDCES